MIIKLEIPNIETFIKCENKAYDMGCDYPVPELRINCARYMFIDTIEKHIYTCDNEHVVFESIKALEFDIDKFLILNLHF